MAGEGSSFQGLRPEPSERLKKQDQPCMLCEGSWLQDLQSQQTREGLRQQFLVTKDFIESIRLLDVCNHGSKLHNMMKMNPWLLEKIEALIQHEGALLRKTKVDSIKQANESLKGVKNAVSLRFCLMQQIQIALEYGLLMKLIYEKHPAPNDEFLLHKQDTLRQMIRRYQERWKGTEPSVSVTLKTNTKTGNLEVAIIRKQLHSSENRLLIKERNTLALQRYKPIMNDEGNNQYLNEDEGPNQALCGHFVRDPLKDCGSAKLRKERLLARLEARERSRDIRRHGLMQIHQDFMARIQRITSELQNVSVDQLELSLSALDLDDCENDEI